MPTFFIDTTPSISTALEVSVFPWVRAVAGRADVGTTDLYRRMKRMSPGQGGVCVMSTGR